MPSFGQESLNRKRQLHPKLQEILDEGIKHQDFTIVCGFRGRKEQELAFSLGNSKKHWPESKHNRLPAVAADLCPYKKGLQWKNREGFYYLMGLLRGIAISKGIKIRLGVDWDMDGDITDQTFNDLPHIELEEGNE